ncbi:TonB-dependent receptor plug domain-containing protein [Megasphaera stantonii]|uniref:TonB-dependent receptor plug domain-containing protein n=1 Tax=Megasphaera stantonii TaxID=2144175 RepID=UPI00320B4643
MKHKRRYALLACAITTWLSLPAFAAETTGGGSSDVTIKDVVVEADRAKEEAKYESQQTTIITAEDIEKKQAKSVEDIIFNETGVTRTVDAMGRVGVSIRGAEPRHTLILIDGQPVMGDFAKYSGQGDELQRLGTENVERIEIIKGAASAKYGSDAIGGVINVITKRPAKEAGLQVNVEGRRAKEDGDLFPYQNFFLRADSGQIGKFRATVYGGKREIMPIYSEERFGGVLNSGEGDGDVRNSLRYYGDIKNIGMSATYDIDERNSIDFNIDKVEEDLERYVKHSDSNMEPQQHFKRDAERNSYRLSYQGNNGGSTDWNVDVSYSKMTEDDITLTSNYGNSKYEGKNTLNYIDDIMHKQWNFNASANTQLNDDHLLSYGFGYSKETGEGSRLKNAPSTTTRYIEPWDYDKNLYTKGGTGEPSSNVHDYYLATNSAGVPYYDQNYEYYGKDSTGNVITPPISYEEYNQWKNVASIRWPTDFAERAEQFRTQLKEENPDSFYVNNVSLAVGAYFSGDLSYKGNYFADEYNARKNRVTVGQAEIKKQYAFLQDTWQVNDRTILSPIVRLDHSDLFGSEITFNMGLTHNLGGKENRRFKANVGTGYTEPGMGELYYNWEMYAGSPSGLGEGRLGYYWVGNPDLQPEKSVNFDIGFEAETDRTSYRLNAFHNKIDDYMTTYFTGYLLDFNPSLDDEWKWMLPPDMIYSFKNIGKAEITGVEAEINHRFDDHWSAKLGYTWLHAINKSDPDMPRQLLDKPQHKIDVGVTYENKGWRASLWGNYYLNMLDSNSIANNGNYLTYDSDGNLKYNFAEGGKQTYQKKTFGLWNLLVQKDIGDGSSVYFGIDNLFNHRDDDRAFMERVYKVGANFKFGPDAHTMNKELDKAVGEAEVAPEEKKRKLQTDWFIQRPFDVDKTEGVEIIGDYRARWNSFTGKVKPEARVTATANVGTAEKNMFEKAGHGFEQRLRLGLDVRIGENTNVTVLGSASGMSGVDTQYDISDSKGLNHQRLENVDVTQHAKKWDFSIGRLTEPMGVTGYWFGKEYDGARAVWTSDKTQVRVGYGDFSSSTGITDSAYTHATRQTFLRAPTKDEWLYGGQTVTYPTDGTFGREETYIEGYESLYQKLSAAASLEEQKNIVSQYLNVMKEHDPESYDMLMNHTFSIDPELFAWNKITVYDADGELVGTFLSNTISANIGGTINSVTVNDLFDKDTLQQKFNSAWDDWSEFLEENYSGRATVNSDLGMLPRGRYTFSSEFLGYGVYTGNAVFGDEIDYMTPLESDTLEDIQWITKEEAKQLSAQSLWDNVGGYTQVGTQLETGGINDERVVYGKPLSVGMESLMSWLSTKWKPEDGSSLPLTFLEPVLPVTGTVLVQDQIPSIERAAFAQVKHQFGDNFGVQAWYLRSLNDDTHSIAYANGDHNDVASFDELANVVGVGATYRLNDKIRFSYEWGQNRTDFGRFMNGHTIYRHESGTSDFDIAGRANGGTPRFWVARIDVGHADTDVPGSWNAFADYKYFEHGSFFGGNGTESLPDRYLDGIKSFTIGGGYVPAKDFLIEAFYTFGAKGIGKRDTLYGSENFELGDYTRLQVTYKF